MTLEMRAATENGAATDDLTADLPIWLQRFLTFERLNLWKPERLRASSLEAQFDSRYLPENCAGLVLPCFWVKRKYLYVYGAQDQPGIGLNIVDGDGPDARVLFPIHPSELEHYTAFLLHARAIDASLTGVRLFAIPTSSTRTMLVWPAGQASRSFFAKLSLHSRILGDRRLLRGRVAGSVGISRIVEQYGSSFPAGIRFFSEPLGLVPRLMPDSGIIFRSLPDEVKGGKVVLAPLFALLGGSGKHRPLLLELMQKNVLGVKELLEEVLLARFAGIWVDLVFGSGIMLEAHAQDLLLALSPDIVPLGRLYYRDFEGVAIDWALRIARRLPGPASLPNSWEWFQVYDTWGYPLYQLVSWKMRTSLFDYLYLVLAEVEAALLEWQAKGVTGAENAWQEGVTLLFSRHLRRAIKERFGMKESEEYNIYGALNRFVKFLMQVRREVMKGVATDVALDERRVY
jgi:hypothetical protein